MGQPMWHLEAAHQWDSFAEGWNSSSQEMWEQGSRKSIVPFMKRYIPKGKAILDVACGDGYGSWKLAQEGYIVTGTDISQKMIELARKRSEKRNIQFIKADMVQLPFTDQTFDAIMVINGLEWTEKPFQALHELKRVLKKDGFLCAAILGPTAHPRKHSYKRLYGKQTIMNTMMPWEFQQLAIENGWKLIGEEGVMKRGVNSEMLAQLPNELKQALSFMWLFMLQK
ncbi:class I SAM-dependent methyltransferase [Bacillus alveayuensis]|uniref:Ubiquinone/menaquinone biosynthesis C-methylase UbiE n=1 Tax=Aeribacillus alveayuensis TaxID=279215 RepID=A0ABT9VP98_9BACI|nr:class I SAM-dependent methyltransferase [Bacillus alveayuensis]MDQ0162794.1 ubiquinone/menaquinone biosynthesis C-methylase UbiE [Bacillus alveayuensis]